MMFVLAYCVYLSAYSVYLYFLVCTSVPGILCKREGRVRNHPSPVLSTVVELSFESCSSSVVAFQPRALGGPLTVALTSSHFLLFRTCSRLTQSQECPLCSCSHLCFLRSCWYVRSDSVLSCMEVII